MTPEDWIISEGQLTYLEQCGSGIDGEVYHVLLKTSNGQIVEAAAKRFKEHYKESELDCQKKELDFLRKLQHPNIVQFFCAVLYPVTIIVTEFASKGSLYDYLKRRTRLPKGQVLEWARQASSAVQYLQQNNVVHRDIKSSNFVITSDDTLKLCDFGIAKKQCKTEKTNQERGTISWMAPEAFVEKVSSKASDIYSLGIVIWELISCKIPYQGRESLSILYAVKVHKLRPEIPDHCPTALKHLMEKCWKENRKKRPDIKEVLDTVETLITKHQVEQSRVEFSGGRKEIYSLYQKHLALENKQNALNEVVTIPIDNGIPDNDDMLSTKTVDTAVTDFEHVDVGEGVSFFTHFKGSTARCLKYILAFALISFAVIGVAALMWHMLGRTDKNTGGCSPPRIKHASPLLKCETQPHSQLWGCLVSCDDGYSWTGGHNDVIVCDASMGTWNISSYRCKESMISYDKGEGYVSPTHDEPDMKRLPVTNDGTGKMDSAENLGTMTKEESDGPQLLASTSPMSAVQADSSAEEERPSPSEDKGSPNHRSSTRIPLSERIPVTSLPSTIGAPSGNVGINQTAPAGSMPLYQEMPELDYSFDLNRDPNLDNSLDAIIQRIGWTNQNSKVDICIAKNCTEVNFSPETLEVVIRFSLAGPTNSMPSHMQMVLLSYYVNDDTKRIKRLLPETLFPSNRKVVFNILQGGP